MSTSYKYNITRDDGDLASATVFAGGDPYVASAEQENFKAIVAALLEEAPLDTIVGLFDLSKPLSAEFARLSDRVTIENGQVFFDGDEVSGPVVDTIVRFYNEGASETFGPLVKFLDNIGQNPNEHSREHLGRWLDNRSFSLDDDGFIIAYKGVYPNDEDDEGNQTYKPSHNGPGVSVNDVPVPNGKYAVQKVGDAVTMARGEVEFNPRVPCSRGLHIGTWSYASGFGTHTLLVRVNPRDVVSVPTDCNDQKMRACRYEILAEGVNAENDSLYTPIRQPAPEPVKPTTQEPAPTAANDVPVKADYAEYRAKDFAKLTRETLREIAKAWKAASQGKVVVTGQSKNALAKGLAKQAGNIRWNRKRGQGFQG